MPEQNNQQQNNSSKWVNYAQAFSIAAAAVLSIMSMYMSSKAESMNDEQEEEIASMSIRLKEIAGDVSSSLTLANLSPGDTLKDDTPLLYGRLSQNLPQGVKLYGALKFNNAYNVIADPIDIHVNGNWNHEFSISPTLNEFSVVLILANQDAHRRLQAQFTQEDYALSDISSYGGLEIVNSVPAYINIPE